MKRTWNITQIEAEKVPKQEKQAFAERKGTQPEGYVDFYEDRQDQIIRKNPATFENLNRVWQFEYLKKHGLKPTDRVLDYGCGPAAAGVYFIEYLDAGNWVGIDISNESIKVGNELIERKGLAAKRPQMIHTPGGRLDALVGQTFDLILAQSVFTHLPPDEIISILQRLKPFMQAGSRFFASFSRTEKGIIQQQLHNWYFDLEFFQIAAQEAGMKLEIMPDWEHPYQHHLPKFAVNSLALFTLP